MYQCLHVYKYSILLPNNMATKETNILSDETYDCLCSICLTKNRNTEAEKYCADCNDNYCSTCVKFHEDVPALLRHKITDKNHFKTRTSPALTMVPTERCDRHNHKPVEMFCQNHDVVGCTSCIVLEHRHCRKVVDICEYLKNEPEASNPDDVYKQLDTTSDILTNLDKKLKVDKNELLNNKSVCQEKVLQFRAKINQRLDQLQQNSLQDIDNKFKPSLYKTDEHIMHIKTNRQEVESARDRLRSAGTNMSQVFVSAKKGKAVVDAIAKDADTFKDEIKRTSVQFNEDKSINVLLDEMNRLGKVMETTIKKGSKKGGNAKPFIFVGH